MTILYCAITIRFLWLEEKARFKMASSDATFGSDDQSGLDPLSSDISPELNEIISELDMAEVDDLDLSTFLETETIKPSGYSYRDLYSMNAPSSLENPMNVRL